MTGKRKETWSEILPRCFGLVDGKFAGHPNERANARELRKQLVNANVERSEVEKSARAVLEQRKGCADIREQLDAMNKFIWRR